MKRPNGFVLIVTVFICLGALIAGYITGWVWSFQALAYFPPSRADRSPYSLMLLVHWVVFLKWMASKRFSVASTILAVRIRRLIHCCQGTTLSILPVSVVHLPMTWPAVTVALKVELVLTAKLWAHNRPFLKCWKATLTSIKFKFLLCSLNFHNGGDHFQWKQLSYNSFFVFNPPSPHFFP